MSTAPAKKTSSIIEISNVGAITYREFEIPREGGVVVLRGANEQGKSTVLNAMRAVLGADVPIPKRDGAKEGRVSLNGSTVKIAKRQSRSGVKVEDIDIQHIEDKYDLATLVDPKYSGDEERDAARIKALVNLSGAKIEFRQFQELVPDGEASAVLDAGLFGGDSKDAIAQANAVKRQFQKEALALEKTATDLEKKQAAFLSACDGIDLNAPSDSDTLQQNLALAIANRSRVMEQHRQACEARQRFEETKQQFEQANKEHNQDRVLALESESTELKALLTASEDRLAKLRAELGAEEWRHIQLLQESKAKQSELEAARKHAEKIRQLQEALSGAWPSPPSDEDMRASVDAVTVAQKAADLGSQVRAALASREKAERCKQEAKLVAERAARLRKAAERVDDVISEAVKIEDLKIRDGRVFFVADGRDELYDRLSTGARWKAAIKVGAMRVGEFSGDGTKMLILDQDAWQHLDPQNRSLINDVAICESVVIVTAECSSGPLRSVIYGETDSFDQ